MEGASGNAETGVTFRKLEKENVWSTVLRVRAFIRIIPRFKEKSEQEEGSKLHGSK